MRQIAYLKDVLYIPLDVEGEWVFLYQGVNWDEFMSV